jgi:lipopolysaccharide/colanic/teichoic acid biosynthesis glycosyltransferase
LPNIKRVIYTSEESDIMQKLLTINNQGKEDPKENAPRRLWEWWKRVARKIGDFNARVILTIFYCMLFSPFAVLVKLLTDPLQIKKKAKKGWLAREVDEEATPQEKAARQF